MKRRRFTGLAAAFCYAPQGLKAQAELPTVTKTEAAARAQEWRQLRLLRGHFDGAPWNDTVDRWQGHKHRLMQAWAARLLSRQASADELLRTLGRPDSVLRPQDPAYASTAAAVHPDVEPAAATPGEHALARAGAQAAQPALWLYHWRGSHDQLVISVQAGHTRATGWLLAHE